MYRILIISFFCCSIAFAQSQLTKEILIGKYNKCVEKGLMKKSEVDLIVEQIKKMDAKSFQGANTEDSLEDIDVCMSKAQSKAMKKQNATFKKKLKAFIEEKTGGTQNTDAMMEKQIEENFKAIKIPLMDLSGKGLISTSSGALDEKSFAAKIVKVVNDVETNRQINAKNNKETSPVDNLPDDLKNLLQANSSIHQTIMKKLDEDVKAKPTKTITKEQLLEQVKKIQTELDLKNKK